MRMCRQPSECSGRMASRRSRTTRRRWRTTSSGAHIAHLSPIDKIHPLWDERVSLARKLKDADGSGAIVVAIDTGVVPFDSSLEIHQGKALGTCDEDPDTIPDSSGVLLHYAAHGTFVVGRIIAENPHAKVSVFRTARSPTRQ